MPRANRCEYTFVLTALLCGGLSKVQNTGKLSLCHTEVHVCELVKAKEQTEMHAECYPSNQSNHFRLKMHVIKEQL